MPSVPQILLFLYGLIASFAILLLLYGLIDSFAIHCLCQQGRCHVIVLSVCHFVSRFTEKVISRFY